MTTFNKDLITQLKSLGWNPDTALYYDAEYEHGFKSFHKTNPSVKPKEHWISYGIKITDDEVILDETFDCVVECCGSSLKKIKRDGKLLEEIVLEIIQACEETRKEYEKNWIFS